MVPVPANLSGFALRYTAAWCSKDAANVATFYSPNGSLSINGGAAAVGSEAITAMAHGFMTTFLDLEVLMDGIDVQGKERFTAGHSSVRIPGLVGLGSGCISAALRSGGSALTGLSLSHKATLTPPTTNINWCTA